MMKRYLAPLLCTVLFLTTSMAINANAQTSGNAAVQSHIAAAKAAVRRRSTTWIGAGWSRRSVAVSASRLSHKETWLPLAAVSPRARC